MENITANTTYGAPQSLYITYDERPSDGNSPAGRYITLKLLGRMLN